MARQLAEPYKTLIQKLLKELTMKLGENLTSVAIFGSIGRGEARKDSDIDLLIIAKKLPKNRRERTELFTSIENKLENEINKLQTNGYNPLLSPIMLTEEEAKHVPPLFLDLVEDAIILYDVNGFLAEPLEKIRKQLAELGAERVWMGRKWYWRLSKDTKKRRVVIVG